jgi:hypothetical protein
VAKAVKVVWPAIGQRRDQLLAWQGGHAEARIGEVGYRRISFGLVRLIAAKTNVLAAHVFMGKSNGL